MHRKLSGGRIKLVPEVLGIWSKDFFARLSTGCHSSHQQEALGFAGEMSLVRSGCDALFIPSSAKLVFPPRFFALPIHRLNLIPFTCDKFPPACQVYTTECENHGAKLLWSKRGCSLLELQLLHKAFCCCSNGGHITRSCLYFVSTHILSVICYLTRETDIGLGGSVSSVPMGGNQTKKRLLSFNQVPKTP